MRLKQFSLNGLTLAIAPSSEHAGYGRVFLEAAGLRFGQDSVDEELDLFFTLHSMALSPCPVFTRT